MWEHNLGDLEQKQVQHKQDLLLQKKISHEHPTMQAHCHAHCEACSENWSTQNGTGLLNGL
jgi:hypothetical protein